CGSRHRAARGGQDGEEGDRRTGQAREHRGGLMDRRALLSFLLLASLACGGSSCGYALAGRGSFLPAYIQTIGIPQFANTTPYYELEQVFPGGARTQFINRGKYKGLPERVGVDPLLTGEILGINIPPASFTDQHQASR